MKKEWISEPLGKKLEAYVGAQGVLTSRFSSTKELVWFACRLFDLDPEIFTTIHDATVEIESLGRRERGARARKNKDVLFPPDDLSETERPKSQNSEQSLQKMMDDSRPKLIDGTPFDCEGELDIDPAKLLRKVVSTVISSGHGDILWEFPDVLAFFGARIPNPDELTGHSNVDERMFDAKNKWPNLKRSD